MQPPLPLGTVLQERYRVVQLLGQGGFGRTYLAEDQGRFKERCALKEFVPQQGEDHFSGKASQLFQREAAILYQIQHPQVPQFRAIFEVDQRLFLVQDYVEGTTYRDLLNQRRAEGSYFTESEVRQFLQQILPVLAHIHGKGIIHRDISPDNIILRQRDHLPVLIDFGVVKEVVTRIQFAENTTPTTTVGKLGYAPSEQMQSGRAYPSSDLYALAVTAIVMLTGKEPQDLFDDVNLTWYWQQYATVSPGLAQVLNKAISHRPGDRYQSVSEMAQALGTTGTAPQQTATAQSPQTPAASFQQPESSQMRTVAVGRPYQATTAATATPRTARPSPPPKYGQEDESIWENPFAVGALGLGLALLAGLGGWAVVSALNSGDRSTTSPTPTETPTLDFDPLATQTPTPTPSPTPTATASPDRPVEYRQQLNLQAGDTTQVSGNLKANETINYQIRGRQGQQLRAQLTGEGVLLSVLDASGNPVADEAQRVLGWVGTLPERGQYTVQLRPVEGLAESDYQLTVALQAVGEPETPDPDPTTSPSPTPEPTQSPTEPSPSPEPEPEPSVQEQRVRFPEGQNSLLVANSVSPSRVRRYVLNAQEGQVMDVEFTARTGPVVMNLLRPNGNPIPDAGQVLAWEGELQASGDYAIEVFSSTESEFTLRIEVRN